MPSKEKQILLHVFKNFDRYHNANSISKEINISPRGALKVFRNLEAKGIVKGEEIGKSIIFKPLLNEYALKFIELTLIEESREYRLWTEEFKEIFSLSDLVMVFGSIIDKKEEARDIDVLIVADKENRKKIQSLINERQKILPKKIHLILLTKEDVSKNMKEHNKSFLSILKTGKVLSGASFFVKLIKNVSSKK